MDESPEPVEPMLLYFSQRTFSDGTWVTISNWCGVRVRRWDPRFVEYRSVGDSAPLLVERFRSSDLFGDFHCPNLCPGDSVTIREIIGTLAIGLVE